MTPLYIFWLYLIGSLAFLVGSVYNIITHAEPNEIFYVYAFGSLCFLYAGYKNLRRHLATKDDIPLRSRVLFDDSWMPEKFKSNYPFKAKHIYIYHGEMPNMRGHCIIQDYDTGKFHIGYHTDHFFELTDDNEELLYT